ncbi:MAG: hypothetical protein Q8N31_12500 [Reyranella sp.]|nr:hypothetical protein [Reyranella sp.]MDP3160833.1 hypothetical protein [Reyranella sp.]
MRGLVEGRTVNVPSPQRVRFEFLGLIEEGPKGIALTELGRRRARIETDADCSAPDVAPRASPLVDALGRSRRRRRSPF